MVVRGAEWRAERRVRRNFVGVREMRRVRAVGWVGGVLRVVVVLVAALERVGSEVLVD